MSFGNSQILSSAGSTQQPTAPGPSPSDAMAALSGTVRVAVDGALLPRRSLIDFRSSRHVSAQGFDDGSAVHVSLDNPDKPPFETARIQYGATIGSQVNQTENYGHSLYVLQSNMASLASDFTNAVAEKAQNDAIRAANGPQCKVLMYKVNVQRIGDNAGNTTWTRLSQNTDESMFLHDSTNARVVQFGSNHATDPQMDPGSVAYQVAGVQRVIQQCLQGGWDGVMEDNLLGIPQADGTYTVNMPGIAGTTLESDASYQAAWVRFLLYATKQFAANGLILMGNAGGTLTNANTVAIYKSYFDSGLTGLMDESFMSFFSTSTSAFIPTTVNGGPNNADGTPVVTNTLQLANYIKPPKFIVAHSYVQGGPYLTPANAVVFNLSVVAALFCDTIIYCVDNCNDQVSGGYATGRLNTPWQAMFDRARQLGRPLGTWTNDQGSQLSTAAGIWHRRFRNGVVVWNNTNGNLVSTLTGANVSSHSSGIVLYRQAKQVLAYSANMTLQDPSTARYQRVVASNAVAFTINPPPSTPGVLDSEEFALEVFNGSGGALGAITFAGTLWGNTASWVQPAATKARTAIFQWNGSVWVLVSITPDW